MCWPLKCCARPGPQAGDLEALAALLEAGADACRQRQDGGRAPLHIAAAADNVAAVQLLLNNGARPDSVVQFTHETPLLAAAVAGSTEAVICLAKADPRLLERSTPGVGTPLHVLARAGADATLAALRSRGLLSQGALVQRDGAGLTPLAAACSEGHLDAARLLLDTQQELPAADYRCALLVACRRGDAFLAQLLLASEKAGREVTAWEEGAGGGAAGGHHPVLLAVEGGHLGVLRALLDAGVPLPGEVLVWAVRRGDRRGLRMLLEAGECPTQEGPPAASSAALASAHPRTAALLACPRCCHCLRPAPPRPAHCAVACSPALCGRCSDADAAALSAPPVAAAAAATASAGLQPGGRFLEGDRATQIFGGVLMLPGRLPLLEELLSWGLDPNYPTDPPDIPLRLAVSNFKREATKMLLKYGADPSSRRVVAAGGAAPLLSAAHRLDLETVQASPAPSVPGAALCQALCQEPMGCSPQGAELLPALVATR